MPITRSKAAVEIDGPDGRTLEKAAVKRQKTEHNSSNNMEVDIQSVASTSNAVSQDPYDPNKNAHLKGRKRFNADLEDMTNAVKNGYTSQGLRLKRIGPGDDEGSFEVIVEDSSANAIISVNFLVSDTSEYPKSHSLFCFSPDPDIPSRLQRIVDEIVDERPRPVREVVDGLLKSVSKATTAPALSSAPSRKHVIDSEDEESHSGDESEPYDYDDDFDIGAEKVEPSTVLFHLQQDFLDVVASSYRPGIIRLGGGDDFIVSVSLPVITLAETIPPRALMAWDRRLLSKSQHLTLLISGFRGVYPALENDGTYTTAAHKISTNITFKVGLSAKYKPGKEQAQEAVRKHGLIVQDAEDELRIQMEKDRIAQIEQYEWDDDIPPEIANQETEEEPAEDEGRFDRFSLSSSLESLIDQAFLRVVQIRRKFGLGWAGAEALFHETEKYQMKAEDVNNLKRNELTNADREEALLGQSVKLPHDPLAGLPRDQPINLPLTAFCYLIRRLSLCTKYCIVCHNKLNTDYEALKPYVCDSKLCSYQYYSLNRGPSLEYEIVHNPQTVDLLVSLAYVAAVDGAMEDPLPIGMGLRVPVLPTIAADAYVAPRSGFAGLGLPNVGATPAVGVETAQQTQILEMGSDGLCDFDDMSIQQMRATIAKLIDMLPTIEEMKKHLERKVQAGKSKPKLREVDPNIIPAAWSILRWIVGSCTSYIEEITSGEELIKNLDPNWRQFKLTVGAPDAEAKFKGAVNEAVAADHNAAKYPILYAFHGSPLRNWHSIVRHGLWYKVITHGRAYGNGVYLAKDANISMGHYAQAARSSWRKSQTSPTNCVALAEVVNLPKRFVSSNPYFVIADTHWIMCRYLLLRGNVESTDTAMSSKQPKSSDVAVPFVELDPTHPTTIGGKHIQIPDPSHQIQTTLDARRFEAAYDEPDDEDMAIFELEPPKPSRSEPMDIDEDDDEDYHIPTRSAPKVSAPHVRPKDDWKQDAEYVQSAVERLMVPPFESTPGATIALQKELRAMLKEQDAAKSLKELGWYMPPELIGDNLYQWIVEMHSFDPDLPIAKDLKAKKVNSVIFEIRFPPRFPISPPFFRIITPRFLPFIHGGGGHVTGGGSICMDLLTADGWLPSYNIPAILMQIKLAISNLDPRPARLSSDWHRPYDVGESLVGFKRAAATHGWTLPDGIDRLVR